MRRAAGRVARTLTMLLALASTSQVRAAERVRVTVFLLPATGFSDKLVASVSNRLGKALRKNMRLKVKDWDKLLVDFSGEAPSVKIGEAEAALEDGTKLLIDGNAAQAVEKLRVAVQLFETVLAYTKKGNLAKSQMALGVAQARAQRRRAAHKTFVELLSWRPMVRFDTKTFGTQEIPLFERARKQVQRLGRGSVELKTDPPGAKAYVDGRYIGVTPALAFGLPVGNHYATFKKAGFIKAAQVVTVSPTMQKSYEQQLRQSEKFLLIQRTLKDAAQGLGKAEANNAMLDMRSVLSVDQIVFATMGYESETRLKLEAYLYDLRSRLRLNQTSLTVNRRELDDLDKLAQMLYLNVRYDGSIPPPPEPPPPPPNKRRPFYATWWFWTAVGAGAAAITLTAVFFPTDDSCRGNVAASKSCVGFRN